MRFTLEEQEQLDCFCELVEETENCRLLRDFHKQPHHVFVGKLPDGTVKDEYPRYDPDDFAAFAALYRQLRLGKDRTNLAKVIELLNRKGDPSDCPVLDSFLSEIEMEGQCWCGATLRDADGDKHLAQTEFEDLLLYGKLVHRDPDKRVQLKQLTRGSPMKAIAFFNYMRFARIVVGYAKKTAEIIKAKDYLNSTSASVSQTKFPESGA